MDPYLGTGETSDLGRQRTPASRGRIPPPPFVAGAVKLSAMDHIESYRQLIRPTHQAQIDNQSAAELSIGNVVPQPSGGVDEVDIIMKTKIVQAQLMTDLQRLLEGINFLEMWLLDDRDRIWIIHTTIAVSCDLILGNSTVRRFLTDFFNVSLPKVAQYFAYPIAIFQIAKLERQILSTASTIKGLEDLLVRVQNGDIIGDRDIKCLTGSRWDVVPWSRLE